jgi:hypothetical protein
MPSSSRGARDYRVFHDPALQLDPDRVGMSKEAVRSWRALVERGLRFEPDQRPSSLDAFADEVEALAREHPVPGRRDFHPSGDLLAARLPDGRDVVVRAISDTRALHTGQYPGTVIRANWESLSWGAGPPPMSAPPLRPLPSAPPAGYGGPTG